jgi:hypothetical protein
MRDVEEAARIAVDCGLKLHKAVGPRLLESVLRLAKQPLGLLMNFGGETFREGLKRVINSHEPFAPSRLRVNQIPPNDTPPVI